MSEFKKVGRPSVGATPITVRLPPELLRALDAFVSKSGGEPSRPEATRRILSDWLAERGYLPMKDNKQS